MIVALFKTRDLPALAPHRHRDGWEVALAEEDVCFVRFPHTEESADSLRHLPCLKRWTLLDDSQLVPVGKTLPECPLPQLSWLPLHSLLPAVPVSPKENDAFFGHLSFSLHADHEAREPAGLILPFARFADWAETAPAPRLHQLHFAISEKGDTIVLGQPLPPLRGESLYQQKQVLIPSGFTLPPYILPEDLPASPGEMLLIEKSGTFHRISTEFFVEASRAAIRLTSRSLISP